ncbi:MAG TPA: hypothetical protein VLK85_22435 [Ramlibacter sp.]|nr:hypothetical protein [Ramlibacter sp.]
MKSIARLSLAAAPLLATLGLLAAQPAAAQSGYVVATPPVVVAQLQQATLSRFWMQRSGPYVPGQKVQYFVQATEGGEAFLDIPGVARGMRLAEAQAGLYTTVLTIEPGHNPGGFEQAVATLLYRDGQRVSARVERPDGLPPGARVDERRIQEERRLQDERRAREERERLGARDRRGPEITDMRPDPGDRIRDRGATNITARIGDDRSGIDSVRMRVDGRDVSRSIRVDNGEVRYRADLAPGRHTVDLAVRDRAGNTSTRSWSFDVVERRGEDRRDGPYGGERRY